MESASEAGSDASDADEVPVLEKMLSFQKVSLALDSHDVSWLHKFVRVHQQWQKHKAREMISASSGSTCLVWYSNDTSPMKTTHTISNALGQLSWCSKSKESAEFVLQSAFILTDGGRHVLIFEPLRVANKTASTHFQCYLHSIQSALVWDGALVSPCSRLHRQYMTAFHHAKKQELSVGAAYMFELLHWFFSARCAMHIAHGALKRALAKFVADKTLMKSSWIVLSSLRNSIGQLHRCGKSWINQRQHFEDWLMPVDVQNVLWRCLGLPSEVIDMLLMLQLRFENGQLKVAKAQRHSKTLSNDIMNVLLAVWRFTEFTESRFIGLGSCARTMIASTLLGLEDLIKFIRDRPNESQWYLNGFSRYDAGVKELMCICAFAAFLPESLISILMADDRLTEVHSQIQEEIADEMSWIHGVPSGLFGFVAAGMQFKGSLAEECYTAVAVAGATVQEGVRYVQEPPFLFVQGRHSVQP